MDEFFEKRVADLEVGDEVRDMGVLSEVNDKGDTREATYRGPRGGGHGVWPAHARVDVRRPVEVTTHPWIGGHGIRRAHIYIGNQFVGFLALQPAEEYAERLRGSAAERAKALGR